MFNRLIYYKWQCSIAINIKHVGSTQQAQGFNQLYTLGILWTEQAPGIFCLCRETRSSKTFSWVSLMVGSLNGPSYQWNP